jgi:biotin carboxylase
LVLTDFVDVIPFDGALDQVVSALSAYKPLFVVPGTESGVELADILCHQLCPELANDINLTRDRRHKGYMGQAIARHGLPHVQQICTNDFTDVENWINNGLVDMPLILKPPKSAGTDSVMICQNQAELKQHFHAMLNKTNKLQQPNDMMLVQEYLAGDEYVVDTFSYHGIHTVTNICKYHKIRTNYSPCVYDFMDFVPFTQAVYGEMIEYTFGVLDALGIKFGPAHSEIMMTANGPRLIETGARMHGGGHPKFCRLCTGDSQLDRMIKFYLDPQKSVEVSRFYQLIQHLRVVFVVSRADGVIRNANILDGAKELKSYVTAHIVAKNSTWVNRTTDLFTILGFIVLSHEDEAVILRDYDTLKSLEASLQITPSWG